MSHSVWDTVHLFNPQLKTIKVAHKTAQQHIIISDKSVCMRNVCWLMLRTLLILVCSSITIHCQIVSHFSNGKLVALSTVICLIPIHIYAYLCWSFHSDIWFTRFPRISLIAFSLIRFFCFISNGHYIYCCNRYSDRTWPTLTLVYYAEYFS